MTRPLLRLTGLTVAFGGLRALDGLDLTVSAGSLTGLIGPNGAGKTTALDAVTGFVPAAGRVELDGLDISGWPAFRRVRAGLARTWQSVELFEDLTVGENCVVASQADDRLRNRPGSRSAPAPVARALELLDLDGLADRLPSALSLGQRKLVGVARALSSEPRLLLLDEPAAGLDTRESGLLGERLRRVVHSGVTLVLVDHDMDLVLGVCDQVAVLDFGRLLVAGSPAAVRAAPEVVTAYLGSEMPA